MKVIKRLLAGLLFVATYAVLAWALTPALVLVNHCAGTGNTMTVCGGVANGDIITAAVTGTCTASLSSASFNVIRGFGAICNEQSLKAYWRIAASEPGSYSITAPDAFTSWAMRIYRNQSPWPFGTHGGAAYGTGSSPSNTLIARGLTTGAPGEIFVGFMAWESGLGSDALTPPAGMGNADNQPAVASSHYGLYSGDLTQASPGTISDQSGTFVEGGHKYGISFTIAPNGWSQAFVNSSHGNGTIAIPSGTLAGHFMVLCETAFNSNPTTPSGWTLQASASGNSDLAWANAYTKVATGSDPSVVFSGATAPSGAIATYSGIASVDVHASCGSPTHTCSPAPSVSPSFQNELAVLCTGIGGTTWNPNTGISGEADSATPPDPFGVIPVFTRESVNWVNSVNMGTELFDYPFYGSETNTPYYGATGNNDTTIVLALKPTAQPVWPGAGVDGVWFERGGW